MSRAPVGYSNATEVAVRRAAIAAEQAELRRELQAEASDEASAAIVGLTESIVAQGRATVPILDRSGTTGAELAGEGGENMDAVMNVALAASGAAHAARAATRAPRPASHPALVTQAVEEILEPHVEDEDEQDALSFEEATSTEEAALAGWLEEDTDDEDAWAWEDEADGTA